MALCYNGRVLDLKYIPQNAACEGVLKLIIIILSKLVALFSS